jgi:hypothetical protein
MLAVAAFQIAGEAQIVLVALLGAPGEVHEIDDTARVGSREPVRGHGQESHRLSRLAALAVAQVRR